MGLGWARGRCAVAMPSGDGAFVLPKLLAQSGCNEMGALGHWATAVVTIFPRRRLEKTYFDRTLLFT